jgi:hypothetical protein
MGRHEATTEIVTVADAVAAMSRDMCEVEWIALKGRYNVNFPSGWRMSIGVSPSHHCSNRTQQDDEDEVFAAFSDFLMMIEKLREGHQDEEKLGKATTAEVAIFDHGNHFFIPHNKNENTEVFRHVPAPVLLGVWNTIIMRNAGMDVCPCPNCVQKVRTM